MKLLDEKLYSECCQPLTGAFGLEVMPETDRYAIYMLTLYCRANTFPRCHTCHRLSLKIVAKKLTKTSLSPGLRKGYHYISGGFHELYHVSGHAPVDALSKKSESVNNC